MKINPIAFVVMMVLSLAFVGKTGFVVADLYFADKPLFYTMQNCSDTTLRVGILWSHIIANLIIIVSAFFIYRLFVKVVIETVWKQRDSLHLKGLFIANTMGFFLAKLGELIAKDFLLEPSEVGCPVFSSAITSSYYLKAAISNLLFDPLFMMVILLMAILSAFLKYSYGLKEENESFI